MTKTKITMEEAQARLAEIIAGLSDDEEIIITQGDRNVARLLGERPEPWERPGPGLAKGILSIVADDDDHLHDFAESMPGSCSQIPTRSSGVPLTTRG